MRVLYTLMSVICGHLWRHGRVNLCVTPLCCAVESGQWSDFTVVHTLLIQTERDPSSKTENVQHLWLGGDKTKSYIYIYIYFIPFFLTCTSTKLRQTILN